MFHFFSKNWLFLLVFLSWIGVHSLGICETSLDLHHPLTPTLSTQTIQERLNQYTHRSLSIHYPTRNHTSSISENYDKVTPQKTGLFIGLQALSGVLGSCTEFEDNNFNQTQINP